MSRPHADFIEASAVAEEALSGGPFAGANRRLLSRDEQTGAETALMRFPAGWSSGLAGLDGPLELLALAPGLRLGGAPIAQEGWARAPLARAAGELSAAAEVEALVMTDPAAPAEGELKIVDVRAMPWRGGVRGGPIGIAVKTLHEGSTVTLVAANIPRYHSGPEFHECPEELYVIAGDVAGRNGRMTAGSYFWRPELITHGPYWSESGLLAFLRGHGDIFAHWIEDADATVEQNRAYAERLRSGSRAGAAGGAGR